MFETLLQIRHKVGAVIVPQSVDGSLQDPSMKLLFEKCGFRNVIELGEMEELPFEGGSITGLPFFGEHSDLNVRSKIAYMVHVNGHKHHVGDLAAHVEVAVLAEERQPGDGAALERKLLHLAEFDDVAEAALLEQQLHRRVLQRAVYALRDDDGAHLVPDL